MPVSGILFNDIRSILHRARQKAYTAVNTAMVEAYWSIGKRITEEEQQGNKRAEYGIQLIKSLANQLKSEFGKGFDERELRRMRQFYQFFPIWDAVRPELTWTHYRLIIRIEKSNAREYYLKEASGQNWSTRQLERNINTLYYERILSTQVQTNTKEKSLQETIAPSDLIKDPYVLEFLSVRTPDNFSENDIETAIINNLQQFLLEMGKGFSFIRRQYRITTDTKHFYVDLVFYNYLLKCFILIDLKVNELTHQDIGQMDMYVRIFEDTVKSENDNPTIGIILCTEKDHTIVKYSVLEESKQLFASKYRFILPTEEELRIELERETSNIQSRLDINT